MKFAIGGSTGARAIALAFTRFDLAVPAGERRVLALAWLWLGVAALAIAGLFSILLVAARTPGLAGLFPGTDFFHVALVVHVDLSVLVWFAALAGVLWTIAGSPRHMALAWAAFALATLGTIVMAAMPFKSFAGMPIMANYVPVLDDRSFLYGLGMFGVGFALLALRAVLAPPALRGRLRGADALGFGLTASAAATVISFGALAWSWFTVPADLTGKAYYEMLFWGPGHTLQFAWTLLLLVAWLWLASVAGSGAAVTARVAMVFFGIGLASVFAVPLIYLAADVATTEHQRLHTWLMRFGGGLAIAPVAAAVALSLARVRRPSGPARPIAGALVCSMALCLAGGLIGFLIAGSDVRVPAHYHGMIVGITLAFMGVAYALLPRFGFTAPEGRLASLQPWLYGGGQLLHIAGLVWSGGYGVHRKVAGAGQVLRSGAEVAGMAVMGLGGLIAIAGGLAFVIVIVRAVRRR